MKRILVFLALAIGCSSAPSDTAATSVGASSGSGGAGGTGGASGSGAMGGGGSGIDAGACDAPMTCQDCLVVGCEKSECIDDSEYQKYASIIECVQTPTSYPVCPSCDTSGAASDECRLCIASELALDCELDCEDCGTYEVIATCEACSRDGGCMFNTPSGSQCYAGVVAYTDQIGCLQSAAVQENCAACVGIVVGDKITSECVGCAKKYVDDSCRLSCAGNFNN